MALAPGTRLGPYEITALIGEGGMGKVWRARHTALNRDDDLKVLPDLAPLNHPNIAHVYGLKQADGVQALVMELVEGETLADRISRGPIPLDEALPGVVVGAVGIGVQPRATSNATSNSARHNLAALAGSDARRCTRGHGNRPTSRRTPSSYGSTLTPFHLCPLLMNSGTTTGRHWICGSW